MFYMINFSPGDVEFAFVLDDGDEAKRAEAGRQVEDEEVVVIHQLTLVKQIKFLFFEYMIDGIKSI